MERKSKYDYLLPEILEYRSKGLGNKQIADLLQMPYQTVSGYLQMKGLKSLRPRGAHKKLLIGESVRTLIEGQGLTQKEAAKQLGVHLATIERVCRREEIKTPRTGPRSGSGHPEWKGGRTLAKHGYIDVYVPMHPLAKRPGGKVAEHRLVMEVVLGRFLLPSEVVDHIDNHPQHNWPDNLRLFASNKDHLIETLTGRGTSNRLQSVRDAKLYSQSKNCPIEQLGTLSQCSSEFRLKLEQYILSLRPTIEHQHLSRKELRGLGAPP